MLRDFQLILLTVVLSAGFTTCAVSAEQPHSLTVGEDLFSPGHTTYSKRVESLTYDVTSLLRDGDNAIGAVLGEGWYAGNLLLRKRKTLLGLTPKLIGQLELTYADGRSETIATDDSWKGPTKAPFELAATTTGKTTTRR